MLYFLMGDTAMVSKTVSCDKSKSLECSVQGNNERNTENQS